MNKTYAGIGSRECGPEMLHKLSVIACKFEQKGYTLFTGGASGCDQAFMKGVQNPNNMKVFTPWPKFYNSTLYLDRMEHKDKAMQIAAQFHPVFNNLTDGAKKLMARNTFQVLGEDCNSPVDFIVCWTPLNQYGEATGGTSQALRIGKKWGIPIYNLSKPDDYKAFVAFYKGL